MQQQTKDKLKAGREAIAFLKGTRLEIIMDYWGDTKSPSFLVEHFILKTRNKHFHLETIPVGMDAMRNALLAEFPGISVKHLETERVRRNAIKLTKEQEAELDQYL